MSHDSGGNVHKVNIADIEMNSQSRHKPNVNSEEQGFPRASSFLRTANGKENNQANGSHAAAKTGTVMRNQRHQLMIDSIQRAATNNANIPEVLRNKHGAHPNKHNANTTQKKSKSGKLQ